MTPANAPPGVGAVLEVNLAAIVADWRLLVHGITPDRSPER